MTQNQKVQAMLDRTPDLQDSGEIIMKKLSRYTSKRQATGVPEDIRNAAARSFSSKI